MNMPHRTTISNLLAKFVMSTVCCIVLATPVNAAFEGIEIRTEGDEYVVVAEQADRAQLLQAVAEHADFTLVWSTRIAPQTMSIAIQGDAKEILGSILSSVDYVVEQAHAGTIAKVIVLGSKGHSAGQTSVPAANAVKQKTKATSFARLFERLAHAAAQAPQATPVKRTDEVGTVKAAAHSFTSVQDAPAQADFVYDEQMRASVAKTTRAAHKAVRHLVRNLEEATANSDLL